MQIYDEYPTAANQFENLFRKLSTALLLIFFARIIW
jgi:hypothetical protein